MASPNTTVPENGDPLGQVLHRLRLTGSLYCRSELSAPWGVEVPTMPGTLSFLAITSGRAWLQVEQSEPVALDSGSLTLIPHGAAHRFTSEPGGTALPLHELDVEAVSERYEVARIDGGGERSQGLYGVVRFDHITGQRLIEQLPQLISIATFREDAASWLHSTVRFIAHEAAALRPGGETIITRLADVMVIQALREWLARDPAARVGWLAALRDDSLSSALHAIADDPGGDWSVDSLARVARMSRSAFAERFGTIVGQSPMHYVTEWRMQEALRLLEHSDHTVGVIAARCGYQSEASFSRAFSRAIGQAPGEARRDRRALTAGVDEAMRAPV